ncbi:MAG: hypothetical protein EBR07_01480 [Planctomycetes bacterium]|nr:hypothetical protein [Planctomycetota bacterium]
MRSAIVMAINWVSTVPRWWPAAPLSVGKLFVMRLLRYRLTARTFKLNSGEELIARVFDAARVHDAVIPGDPVTSTLKKVSEDAVDAEEADAISDMILGEISDSTKVRGRKVVGTISRERLVAVQTPQVFRAELLRRAYAQPGLDGATDDAMLVERLGAEVIVVDGDPRNIKVTTPADLLMVRALLKK